MQVNSKLSFLVVVNILLINSSILSQKYSPVTYWSYQNNSTGFSIEVLDINTDYSPDFFVGNFNETLLFYGGFLLNSLPDARYRGRVLALCDFNGDNYQDLITMHFTSFDTSNWDYRGEILFFWGSGNPMAKLDTIVDYSIPIPTLIPQFDRFGIGSVQNAVETGDLNDDGKDDLVISSYRYESVLGCLYVYLGRSVPSPLPDYKITGRNVPGEVRQFHYGEYFQIADINRDYRDDLLISSVIKKVGSDILDSLNILHVYYGGVDFAYGHEQESAVYKSKVIRDRWPYEADWFLYKFSVEDINGDGWDDLLVARDLYPKSSHKVLAHNCFESGIDTVPFFTFSDIDTTDNYFFPATVAFNIGDINNDTHNDFLFPGNPWYLYLGGPFINNNNPIGMGIDQNYAGVYPTMAIGVGKQNNDIYKDILMCRRNGFAEILLGTNLTTGLESEKLTEEGSDDYFAFPNPFDKKCTIQFSIEAKEKVKITIYDSMGGSVAELLSAEGEPGKYEVEFDAGKIGLSSGVYFAEIDLGKRGKKILKLMYLK